MPVELGVGGFLAGWPTLVFVFGLLLIAVLMSRGVKGAILIGIASATLLAIVLEAIAKIGPSVVPGQNPKPTGWGLNVPKLPGQVVDRPDFGLLGDFNLLGVVLARSAPSPRSCWSSRSCSRTSSTRWARWSAIGAEAGLLDEEGTPPNASGSSRRLDRRGRRWCAPACRATPATSSRAAGVGEGARTGLASVVTGVLFLLATFLAPLVSVVPYEAATPALVIVGFLMMTQVKGIDWDDYGDRVPGLPDDRPDAVHLLDHGGHRCRLRLLRRAQTRPRQGPRPAPADVGHRRRCSWSTSRSTRSSTCSGCRRPRTREPL